MPFGLVSKTEYEKVVAANNELRAKMEKLRLQNILLKDRVRVLSRLPQELSLVYIVLQENNAVTIDELAKHKLLKGRTKNDLIRCLDELCSKGMATKGEKEGEAFYSVQTPDYTHFWAPENKEEEGYIRPFIKPERS